MKLVVTEKNIAAQKIADLLGVGKPKADKVYSTPVYRFERDGEEWVTIGLRGHILEPNFVPALTYKKRGGWIGVDANGEMIPADLPTDLPKPPFKKKKPFVPDGVELNAWKMDALPYLIYAPIEKLPKEKDIIRSLKNLAKKADSIVIATDFDREGELIGSDALTCIREVNEEAPVSRARYSAITKEEITRAFTNLVELDVDLAQAGASRQDIDLIWGAVLTRYLTLVNGEPFAAKGDVLVKPGFRAIYPYGLKKDEQLPALEEGEMLDFGGATKTHKQTEPPARYSQGKLIQEMEKLGLGTKSTRHSIIERLYTVKYVQNDPIEPSQLGIAVIDALDKFAPHITSSAMTANLEEEMSQIAAGDSKKVQVVRHSRDLLAQELENLLPHQEEVRDALADAVAADAYVGPCPKCGKDLQLRSSQKTRSMFIGCAGWPDCDVTYPLPKGKIEALEEKCPTCGMPQIKVTAFRSKPRVLCIDPECETNKEPDLVVGTCPTCAEQGKEAKLIAHKNPRTLKRFIRCENYDECQTGYPLPQYGALTATEEVCEECGAPMVIVTTARGPWKLCPNFSCPSKEKKEKGKASSKGKAGAKKSTAKKSSTKKTTKAAAKK